MTADPEIEEFLQIAGEQRYYPVHLAEIGRTRPVTLIGDVYDDRGGLVVPKGTSIDYSVAERLLRHRLLQPLEQMIRLENTMTPEELAEEFERTLQRYPDTGNINASLKFRNPMNRLTASYLTDPVLLQELTILKERLPAHFRKTMFCAWLSILIASELGVSEDVLRDVYLAGLTRDIGFLHVAESTIRRKQPLTTRRWKEIQSHVFIGSRLLEKLYGRDSGAARAVLEHHERNDGTGYPFGKRGERLDVAGQVVGLVDTIQAIRIDRFEPMGRNLRDISPFLKIHSNRIRKELYEAAYSILSRSGLPYSCSNPHGDATRLVDVLAARSLRLREALTLLQELDEPVRTSAGTGKRKIEASILFIKEIVRTSGLASENIIDWFLRLQKEPSAASLEELTEMEILQHEICWELDKLYRIIHHEIGEEERSDPAMEKFSEISKKIFGRIAEA